MGGREWWRERGKKKKKRHGGTGGQPGSNTEPLNWLRVCLYFPVKEVSIVVLQFDIVLRSSSRQEWSGMQSWPCSPLRPATSVVFLVFINTSVVLTFFFI